MPLRHAARFSLGSAFATGARLYVGNLPVILPISLVAFAPAFAVIAIDARDVFQFEIPRGIWGLDNREVASLLGGVWLQTGLVPCVMTRLEGGYSSVGEDLVESVRSLMRFAYVGLIGGALVLAGFLALVVPGFILATMLWVAVPSAVVEQQGLLNALRRSFELTRGHRFRILALILLIAVVGGVADLVFAAIAALIGMGLVSPDVFLQCAGIVVWSLLGTIAVVCYHDLRLLKEGPSARSVARVFD